MNKGEMLLDARKVELCFQCISEDASKLAKALEGIDAEQAELWHKLADFAAKSSPVAQDCSRWIFNCKAIPNKATWFGQ